MRPWPLLWTSLVGAVLSACAHRVSLTETPITGAADPQLRAEVRAVLEDFDRDVGAGRVRLSEVRFAPSRTLGAFSPSAGRVLLDEHLPLSGVRGVLTHELCHALDFAEGLAARPLPPFDALAPELFQTVQAPGVHPERSGRRFRRREAFAAWCGLGPLAAQLLSSPCGDEPAEITGAARWLVAQAWRGAAPLGQVDAPERSYSWRPVASGPPVGLAVDPTAAPGAIRILVAHQLPSQAPALERVVVDVRSGAPVREQELPPKGEELVAAPPLGALAPHAHGWPSGPAAVLAHIPWFFPEPARPRLLWSDGRGWSAVGDGCSDLPRQQVFTADGEVWLSWVEQDTVRWRPVAEPP